MDTNIRYDRHQILTKKEMEKKFVAVCRILILIAFTSRKYHEIRVNIKRKQH